MESSFATMFEEIRHDISILLILSTTDPDRLKQSIFMDREKI